MKSESQRYDWIGCWVEDEDEVEGKKGCNDENEKRGLEEDKERDDNDEDWEEKDEKW